MDVESSAFDYTTNISDRDSRYSIDLNENLNFSELNLSKTSKQQSVASTPNMSITLAPEERQLLRAASPNDETTTTAADAIKQLNGRDSLTHAAVTETEPTHFANITLEDSVSSPHIDAATSSEEPVYFADGCIELGRRLWKSNAQAQQYTKGCLWSPDGTCLLVPVHLDGMHVVELPHDLYTTHAMTAERELSALETAVHVKEGGTVYDYVWYPFMDSKAPETCCWLASRQHEPIHMWDAFTGKLRCTYRGYDDVDEVESAISITFTNDGEKIIGGYKKSIKIFDTNIPGRDCSTFPVKQAISCLALNADSDETVTAGSWNGYINHYDLRAPKLGALFTLGGHSGGITWLRYASLNGNWALFSGARKDNKILQWDMRNYEQPLCEFHRTVDTNQRIYFDLSPEQRWLVSGDTSGMLRIWDLHSDATEVLPLHADCCNGVNFHPNYPILATTSGQYHFVDVAQDEEGSAQMEQKIVDYENSLLLLWVGRKAD